MALCTCVGAGIGSVDVTIDGPTGKDKLKPAVNQQSDNVWVVQFTPVVAGPHTVNVYYADQPVDHSPFTTLVKPCQSLCICLSVIVFVHCSAYVCSRLPINQSNL